MISQHPLLLIFLSEERKRRGGGGVGFPQPVRCVLVFCSSSSTERRPPVHTLPKNTKHTRECREIHCFLTPQPPPLLLTPTLPSVSPLVFGGVPWILCTLARITIKYLLHSLDVGTCVFYGSSFPWHGCRGPILHFICVCRISCRRVCFASPHHGYAMLPLIQGCGFVLQSPWDCKALGTAQSTHIF